MKTKQKKNVSIFLIEQQVDHVLVFFFSLLSYCRHAVFCHRIKRQGEKRRNSSLTTNKQTNKEKENDLAGCNRGKYEANEKIIIIIKQKRGRKHSAEQH